MNTSKITLIAGILLFVISNLLHGENGYKINIEWKGLPDSTIYLAKYRGSSRYITDTLLLDKNAKGVFLGDSLLDQGLYFVYKKPSHFFDILVGSDQEFTIKSDFNTPEKPAQISGSKEGEQFIDFQEKLREASISKSKLLDRLKAKPAPSDSSTIIQSQLNEVDEKIGEFIEKETQKDPTSMFSVFVNATLPVKIPDAQIDEKDKNIDSLRWIHGYHYRSEHFLDHFDFGDERILNTPLFHQSVENYLDKLTIRHPDTLVRVVNKLIDRSKASPEVFRYLSEYLLNKYYNSKYMGMDAVFLTVGEKVYTNGLATWVDSVRLQQITKEVILTRQNVIGKIAPELKVLDKDNHPFSLHSVQADYTILAFYEPNCGFCGKEIPALYNEVYLKLLDHNVEVVAFCTVNKRDEWIEFIDKHELEGWYHVYDPNRESYFDIKYNVQKTPLIYILDKNKKIIAKRVDSQVAKKFIESLVKE